MFWRIFFGVLAALVVAPLVPFLLVLMLALLPYIGFIIVGIIVISALFKKKQPQTQKGKWKHD